MKIVVLYEVVAYSQVLYAGTWEDGDWDWELKKCGEFKNLYDAKKCFEKITISNDLPLVRLFKVTKYISDDEYDKDEELLLEKEAIETI